jgi:4-amino-4-deoxy-L-arabinose transferase-like glycosyltransferase
MALPFLSFLSVLLILGLSTELRSAAALLLLPPLVLLAVPGVSSLRRGAANAFDWFGMMIFTFLAAVVWIAWSAMVFGWPERLARQAVRLEPGFVGHFSLVAFVFSILATIIWCWLIVTSPRSPMRGIMHWMSGLTLFWLLIATLWMPWIDYGKSYRLLSASLARTLPAKVDCVANANLPDSILASLDYFDRIRTVPLKSAAGKACNWLLVQGEARDPAAISAAGWRKVWEGRRPSDRRESEKFHLFRRDAKANKAASLSDLLVITPEVGTTRP